MSQGRKLDFRERHAEYRRCRICGELKLCDVPNLERLERLGVDIERRPFFTRGPACIDCKREAAKAYGLTRKGKPKAIQWFGPEGRHPKFSKDHVNVNRPLFHQIPKELRPAAKRMLEERIKNYTLRWGKPPNVHVKYLLVANVIRTIRSPNGAYVMNYLREKMEAKRHRAICFARWMEKTERYKISPIVNRSGFTVMEGI